MESLGRGVFDWYQSIEGIHVDVWLITFDMDIFAEREKIIEHVGDLYNWNLSFQVTLAIKLRCLNVTICTIFRAKHDAVCGHYLFVFQEQDVTYFDFLEFNVYNFHILPKFLTLYSVDLGVWLVANVVGYSFFNDAKSNNECKYGYDNVGLVYSNFGKTIAHGNAKPDNITEFSKLQKKSEGKEAPRCVTRRFYFVATKNRTLPCQGRSNDSGETVRRFIKLGGCQGNLAVIN